MTFSRLLYPASLIVICTQLAGCKPKAVQVPEATPAPAIVDGTPATEADYKEFVKSVERAINTKNRTGLERLISMETLAIRCLSDLSITGSQRQSIIQGMKQAMQKNSLATQIMADVENGGSYKLLRVHEVDGRSRAMIRLIGSDGGVNYHDIILTRSPEGRISVEDIYVFLGGEMLTQAIRRLLLPAVAELNQGSLAGLRGADRTFLNNMPRFQAMAEAIRNGNKPEAIKIYKSLPTEFKEQKAIVLIYVSAADGDDAEYATALEAYRKLFPTDPAMDFISIDYFHLKKQYDEALRCIEKTDKAVGGDPYLQSVRANTLIEARRFKEACEAAEKAIEQEPDLSAAYWSRISAAVKEKNHPDTLVWLKKLIEKTSDEVADLTSEAEYADFVKSPQHAEWVKWYAAKKK